MSERNRLDTGRLISSSQMRSTRSKAQLFLLEFVLVVMMFALCAAVCVSVFVKADSLSEDVTEQSESLAIMQNAAEIIKSATQTDPQEAEKFIAKQLGLSLLPQDEGKEGNADFVEYFDEKFQRVESIDNCKYTMYVEISSDERGMLTAALTMKDIVDEKETGSLLVKKYIPAGENHGK